MGKITAQELGIIGNFSAGTITAALSGNASTATKLQTGRTISLTGDVTGTSGAFDGSGNLSFAATLANSGVTTGTYTKVTVDAKGRVTTGATASVSDITGAAPLASPALTGTPTAPTAATATNNTQIATTAFVKAQGYLASADFDTHNNDSIRHITSSERTTWNSNRAPYQSVSGSTGATVGWYRIATSASGISNCNGRFDIVSAASGYHTACTVEASISYGISPDLTILNCSHYSGKAISKIRVVYHTTYSGNYAYLEIYTSAAVAMSTTVGYVNGTGWTLLSPSTAGSIPSGYTSVEMDMLPGLTSNNPIYGSLIGSADLLDGYHATTASQPNSIAVSDANNNISAAKFTASSQFVSTVATGTAPLVVSSTTKVANLNVSLVEGLSPATTATANTLVARNASGYIFASYINSSRGEENSPAVSYIYDTGDGYMRKKSVYNTVNETNKLNPALVPAGNNYMGETIVLTAASAVIRNYAVYMTSTGVAHAMGNSDSTMPAIGVACADTGAGGTVTVLLRGLLQDTTWNLTPGTLYYVSTTSAGNWQNTRPSSSGNRAQIIGVAVGPKMMYINPQLVWVTV